MIKTGTIKVGETKCRGGRKSVAVRQKDNEPVCDRPGCVCHKTSNKPTK